MIPNMIHESLRFPFFCKNAKCNNTHRSFQLSPPSCAGHNGEAVVYDLLDLVECAPPPGDRQAHALDLDSTFSRLADCHAAVDDEHTLASKLGRVAIAEHCSAEISKA
uniref:Uncharacterized protein n=1 Tax=Bionectria ochroleuca TaxID=29856 RepID=A0A8H7NIS4_BIOOC